jgi:hypothetical protein
MPQQLTNSAPRCALANYLPSSGGSPCGALPLSPLDRRVGCGGVHELERDGVGARLVRLDDGGAPRPVLAGVARQHRRLLRAALRAPSGRAAGVVVAVVAGGGGGNTIRGKGKRAVLAARAGALAPRQSSRARPRRPPPPPPLGRRHVRHWSHPLQGTRPLFLSLPAPSAATSPHAPVLHARQPVQLLPDGRGGHLLVVDGGARVRRARLPRHLLV